MKILFENIKSYIDSDSTDYALMITGEWGSGKTHYIKNVIIPFLKEEPKNNKNSNKYIPLYISLNGISNIENISDKVFLSIYKIEKGNVDLTNSFIDEVIDLKELKDLKLVKSILKIGIKKYKKHKLSTLKNYIIFFDDLERINTKLNISEVFGFINTNFVEHNFTKVIFLCDESKIKENEIYKQSKEKIIRRTVYFKH